jgi:hypothetical protein
MANRERLRPADTILPEYLENPFPAASTRKYASPAFPPAAQSDNIDFRAPPTNQPNKIKTPPE